MLDLEEVYKLDTKDNIHQAIGLVFETIDRLFHDSKFKECDDILAKVDTAKLSSSLLRSFLVITYPAKDKLNNRARFFKDAKQTMIIIRGDEITKKLLRRLE